MRLRNWRSAIQVETSGTVSSQAWLRKSFHLGREIRKQKQLWTVLGTCFGIPLPHGLNLASLSSPQNWDVLSVKELGTELWRTLGKSNMKLWTYNPLLFNLNMNYNKLRKGVIENNLDKQNSIIVGWLRDNAVQMVPSYRKGTHFKQGVM